MKYIMKKKVIDHSCANGKASVTLIGKAMKSTDISVQKTRNQ